MERAAEWFALITCIIVGLSHLLCPKGWTETFAMLHRLGTPGAFANGGLSLVPGEAFVATHNTWAGPATVLTMLGWMLVVKGALCFLVPAVALRGMRKAGAGKGREFMAGGVMLLVVAGIVGYVLWIG